MATLNGLTLKASITWELLKTVTGYKDLKWPSQTKSFRLTPASSVADSILATRYTIAAAGTQVIDLSSFTDAAGDTITGAKAVGILLIPTGTNAKVKLEKDATNGLVWMLGATSTIEIPAGGVFCACEPVGTTIDGTHKRLLLTNTGSGSLTLDVVIFVKD